MSIHVNVNGTWKQVNDPRVNVSGTWKQVNEVYVNVNGTWKQVYKRIVVPAGLIIPYNGTSAPSGWSLFTDADGRFIIGAGKTYAVGATGGSTSITTNASDSQGAHTGATEKSEDFGSMRFYTGTGSAGAHVHTLTYNYTPPYYGLRLIKADSELSQLPAKAVMFAGETLSGITRFSSGDGKLFASQSSIGAGGSNTISAGTNSSSAGAHKHNTTRANNTSFGGYLGKEEGSHIHTNAEFTITPNLYRALLSAWTNASSAFRLQPGMYAFWESIVNIPDGWLLCDGSNGTLDLRNYFIEFADEDDDGTRTGDGTLTVPNITLATYSWRHSHNDAVTDDTARYGHQSSTASHYHTIAGTTPTFLPPYYALAIIQLAA